MATKRVSDNNNNNGLGQEAEWSTTCDIVYIILIWICSRSRY